VQVVDPGSLLLALNFLKQVNNAYFRIGFNSLGAYGTINHLHFQVCPSCFSQMTCRIDSATELLSSCKLAVHCTSPFDPNRLSARPAAPAHADAFDPAIHCRHITWRRRSPSSAPIPCACRGSAAPLGP